MKRLLVLLMLTAPLWAQKPRVQPPPIDATTQAKLTALKTQIDAAKADLDAATKKLNDLQSQWEFLEQQAATSAGLNVRRVHINPSTLRFEGEGFSRVPRPEPKAAK